MNYIEFGLAIMLHRARRRINQAAFAKQAGLSRNYLAMIERGERHNFSIGILMGLAGAMQTDPCELLKILTNHDAD